MNAPNDSGVPPPTRHPAASMRDVTSDIAKIALMSRLSASIIARGVAAGATNPFHAIASNPGKPL